MKELSFLSFMGLALFGFPQAGNAYTVWQGEAVVTSASGHCTFNGDERRNISTGTVLKSVFRPRAIDNNGANIRISFIHDSNALFVMVLPDTRPGGNYARAGINHSGMQINTGLRPYASYQQTPVNVALNTTFVSVSGRVDDFMFLAGCDVTFRASYSKR